MRKAGLINKVKYEPKSFYEKPIQGIKYIFLK